VIVLLLFGTRENADTYDDQDFTSYPCRVRGVDFRFCSRTNQSASTSKILAFENKWNAAYKHGDIAAMESLLADDFIITLEDGSTFSKSGYIAHNGDKTLHVEITEMSGVNVRMHGSVAVVTGAYHEKGVFRGKPYEYHDRFTDVWMNTNGKWQVIASHYSIPSSD
jgi:ketosteroid isomerase-like protein